MLPNATKNPLGKWSRSCPWAYRSFSYWLQTCYENYKTRVW
jgi:hypothetical protein